MSLAQSAGPTGRKGEPSQRAQSGERKRLDSGTVDKAGGLAELPSTHADKVMARAAPDERRKRVVESVFRALTDVSASFSAPWYRRFRQASHMLRIANI